MGAQLSKGGVAVEGKAAADPAAAKANGQVSKAGPVRPSISREPHGTRRSLAAWVPRWGAGGRSFVSGFVHSCGGKTLKTEFSLK